MILIPYFQQIVSLINTGDSYTFYYGEKGWQNLVEDNITFPAVLIDFISTVKYTLPNGGYIGETYPVSIYFGYKSELDWTTIQHEVEINKANNACRNFLSQLQNYKDSDGNKIVDSIEVVSADRVILRPNDDVGTSGILLKLNVKPSLTLSVCV